MAWLAQARSWLHGGINGTQAWMFGKIYHASCDDQVINCDFLYLYDLWWCFRCSPRQWSYQLYNESGDSGPTKEWHIKAQSWTTLQRSRAFFHFSISKTKKCTPKAFQAKNCSSWKYSSSEIQVLQREVQQWWPPLQGTRCGSTSLSTVSPCHPTFSFMNHDHSVNIHNQVHHHQSSMCHHESSRLLETQWSW